jgi:hypothetical protein
LCGGLEGHSEIILTDESGDNRLGPD